MHILLINLKKASDRAAFQEAQFATLGLSFERIDAVSGDVVDENYYRSVSTRGLRLMTRNEVACFLSHQKCWEMCVERNEPVIILEDDIVLSAGFPDVAKAAISAIEPGLSLTNLEMFSKAKRVQRNPIAHFNYGHTLHKMIFAAAGAGAYIINPETARHFIARATETFNLADLFMYSEAKVMLLQVVPAPAMQMSFLIEDNPIAQSTIHNVGEKRPSSLQSFMANPMTRVRRLKANIKALYLRLFASKKTGQYDSDA